MAMERGYDQCRRDKSVVTWSPSSLQPRQAICEDSSEVEMQSFGGVKEDTSCQCSQSLARTTACNGQSRFGSKREVRNV